MSILASNYEVFELKSEGKDPINVQGKTAVFEYFESIFMPYISARMVIVDAGDGVNYPPEIDRQERTGSIFNAYAIKGGEEVKFRFANSSGILDFSKKPLIVKSSANIKKESNRDVMTLELVSDFYNKNESSQIGERLNGKYSDSLKSLLSANNITFDEKNIEPTSNSGEYMGNSNKLSDVIVDIAKKASPAKGPPGFFFYENQKGHNFKSIESLINQKPFNPDRPYFQSEVMTSGLVDGHNDYKVAKFDMIRNQDLESLFKSGSLMSKINVWDPKTQVYSEKITGLEDLKLSSIGSFKIVPDKTFDFSKTYWHILDNGTMSPKVNEKPKESEKYIESDSQTRYNILLSRIIKVQIPCNFCLKVGDMLKFVFDPVTTDSKVQGPEPNQSGNYLVIDLCHYCDPKQSYTTMLMVRDSLGKDSNTN